MEPDQKLGLSENFLVFILECNDYVIAGKIIDFPIPKKRIYWNVRKIP